MVTTQTQLFSSARDVSCLKILMELRPCFYGFSGIPQETRLLFASLLRAPNVCVHGLLDTDYFKKKFLSKNAVEILPHERIKLFSDLIIASMGSHGIAGLRFFLTRYGIYLNNLLGRHIPVQALSVQGFEDFIWDRLFAKTLTKKNSTSASFCDFQAVTNALYCYVNFSRYTLNHFQCCSYFPKLDTRDYDIFLVQTPYPGRVAKNTKLVVRYHDAVPLLTPHLTMDSARSQVAHFNALCSNASHAEFVCTSKAVQNDLVHVFPQILPRSHVIHNMIADEFYQDTQPIQKVVDFEILKQILNSYSHKLPDNLSGNFAYILSVSTIEPRKNQIRLIKAWESVRLRSTIPLKLVFVGELGWQVENIVSAMQPWLEQGDLIHLRNIPIEYLRLLYQGARCIVCPSVKEGFDYSGVEGMACGGVVVASDIAVHREIYGDAAWYFDPYAFQDQAQIIEKILNVDAALRIEMQLRGLAQAKKYHRPIIQQKWEEYFAHISRKI